MVIFMSELCRDVEDYISPVTLEFGDVVEFPVSPRDAIFIEWGARSVIYRAGDKGFYAGRIVDRDSTEAVGLATPGTSWAPVRKTGARWTLGEIATAFEYQHGKSPRPFEEYYGHNAGTPPVSYPQGTITKGLPRS